MIFRSLIAAAVITLGAAACSYLPSGVAETPAQRVFALKSEFSALVTLAAEYESLPRCPETASKVCSDPGAVATIRKAANAADATLDAAEDTVRSPLFAEGSTMSKVLAAATNSVKALGAILTQLGVT